MIFNQIESYGSWSNKFCSKFLSIMEVSWIQFSKKQTSSVPLIILCNRSLLKYKWFFLPFSSFQDQFGTSYFADGKHLTALKSAFLSLSVYVVFSTICRQKVKIDTCSEQRTIWFSKTFWVLKVCLRLYGWLLFETICNQL